MAAPLILFEGMKGQKIQQFTAQEVLLKAAHYCAYQERCHQEVVQKLIEWGVSDNDRNLILMQLIEQNYLNEERFARAFAGGKFRTKQWGRLKILRELQWRRISDYCIRAAMEEIDEAIYRDVLNREILKKCNELKGESIFRRNQKVAGLFIRKGFEADLIWEVLKEVNQTEG